MSSSKSVECNAGGHDSCFNAECVCECHLPDPDSQPVSPPEAQWLAPVYTNAHWAIEKAIEVYKANPEEHNNIIDGAAAVLAFLEEHAYGGAEEPVATTENPQRGSWR